MGDIGVPGSGSTRLSRLGNAANDIIRHVDAGIKRLNEYFPPLDQLKLSTPVRSYVDRKIGLPPDHIRVLKRDVDAGLNDPEIKQLNGLGDYILRPDSSRSNNRH